MDLAPGARPRSPARPALRAVRSPGDRAGPPPECCEGRGHTKVTACRERRRLTVAQAGTTARPADTDTPVMMAKVTGAELLCLLRAEADRDRACHAAAQAERAAQLAQREATCAQRAPPRPIWSETGRVRADAEKMLVGFRADAARDRDELRADLRIRAERAERLP